MRNNPHILHQCFYTHQAWYRIISFLRRALRPTLQEVNDKTLTSFQTVDDMVFLGQLDPNDKSLNKRYRDLADQYRDRYSFGIARPPRQGHSIVRCFNNIDDEQYVADELGIVEGLENFVKKCSAPLIPELTRTNEAEYAQVCPLLGRTERCRIEDLTVIRSTMQSGKSLMHFFVTTEEEKERFREEARPLAKKYNEFLHFAITDLNEYPEMLGIVGLKPGAKTGLALQNPNTGEMFPYTGKKKITPEVVDKFLNDIIDGKIAPKGGRGQSYGHNEL